MKDVYKTITAVSEGLYKEKGSRFIAFAYPVSSEDQIKEIVSGLKEKYYDARHHCYAWILGADKKHFRANDDGEPSSTGGKPILGQIQSNDLTNILVVVIRYFGGIKLGVSGLISAYRAAAVDALNNAIIIEKTVDEQFHIRFSYEVLNDVMRVIKEESPDVLERNFGLECEMLLSIRQSSFDFLKSRLEKVISLTVVSDKH